MVGHRLFRRDTMSTGNSFLFVSLFLKVIFSDNNLTA